MTSPEPLIVSVPGIRFGKPCVAGTRIAVQDILGWLASGMSQDEILEDFPELTAMHLRAALGHHAPSEDLALPPYSTTTRR